MNKAQLDHVKARVQAIVICTNGNITSKMNALVKDCSYSRDTKLQLIADGKAKLLPSEGLEEIGSTMSYNPSVYTVLIECFSYPRNPDFVRYGKFNERVEAAGEEMQATVEAKGREIVDRVVISGLTGADLIDALGELSKMDVLATDYVAAMRAV